MQKHLVTPLGYKSFVQQKKSLEQQRPAVVLELKRAREMGDLSENGFYKGMRAKLSQIDSTLRHLKKLIMSAQVIEKPTGNTIEIGSRVTIYNGNQNHEFFIVGSVEADPALGKISQKSPIGSKLLGKKKGDTVEITTPSGKIIYEIVSIA